MPDIVTINDINRLPTVTSVAGTDMIPVTKGGVLSKVSIANAIAGDSGVTGPGSSTNGNVVLFNGATGQIIKDGGQGLPTGTIVGTSDSQSLTNKTIAGGTNSISGNLNPDITFPSSQTDAHSTTTLANIAGMVQTVVPGTYAIRIKLAGTAGASGGWKLAFKLTTTAITSWGMTGIANTASAVAVAHTTTTTDQTSLIASTSAAIAGEIYGVAVIGTGGTMQLQFAQNVSDGTTCSIYTDSFMTFQRIV